MPEMGIQSLGGEDPQEEEMATHSSVFAWTVPWPGEPGESAGLQKWNTAEHEYKLFFTNFWIRLEKLTNLDVGWRKSNLCMLESPWEKHQS